VDVTVLAIPGCPGAALLEERLAAAVRGLPGVRITRRVITSQAQAAEAGMHGSPTLLVDGADPFARPGQQPGLACRLYRQEDGSLVPAPPAAELHRVFAGQSRRDTW
jgi:hypothetical protein